MVKDILNIVSVADSLTAMYDTSDPFKLARAVDVEILKRDFKRQKGAYKVILKNRFIFIKKDLSQYEARIVAAHELGHDLLHREYAMLNGGFEEYSLFNRPDDRMEYEANIFAAQLLIADGDFLEYAAMGYDTEKIAKALKSHKNLVALKGDILIKKGYPLKAQEHSGKFLRYDQ